MTGERSGHPTEFPLSLLLPFRRFTEVNSTSKLVVLALGLVASLAACSNDTTAPPPPAKPPQIAYSVSYSRTTDAKGQPTGLPSNDVNAFLTLSNGQFWVGTAAGIARFTNIDSGTYTYDESNPQIVNEVNGLPHPLVTSMVEFSGKVYVATWGGGIGIYDIAGDTWSQIRPGDTGLTEGYIAEAAVSPTEGLIYFATNSSVFIYKPSDGTITHYSTVDQDLLDIDPEVISPIETQIINMQTPASCLEVTDNGGVIERWYGPRVESRVTDPRQISRLGIMVSKDPDVVYRYTTLNSGLIEFNVNDIYYDSVRQSYWVSYPTSGLAEVNVTNKKWTTYTLAQGLPSNTVYSVARAGDGAGGTTMWAATQNGLAKMKSDGHWQGYGTSGGLPANRVRRVYSDDGKHLWAAFIEGGAVKIKI